MSGVQRLDRAPHMDCTALIGHNGGPPIEDEHVPVWGPGPIRAYFSWRRAKKAAFAAPCRDIALLRVKRAERLGLTYEEYMSEMLDTGRHLQPQDAERIAEIIARRQKATTP